MNLASLHGHPGAAVLRNAIAGSEREIMPILKAGIDPKTMELDDRTAGHVGEVMAARIRNSIVALKEPATLRQPSCERAAPIRSSTESIMKNSVTYEVTDPRRQHVDPHPHPPGFQGPSRHHGAPLPRRPTGHPG